MSQAEYSFPKLHFFKILAYCTIARSGYCSVGISPGRDQEVQAKQFKMELLNIFAFLAYIQNVQGFFNPYQMPYLREVPVSWPYNYYYYPTYPQQPEQIHVSLFLVAASIVCQNSSQQGF